MANKKSVPGVRTGGFLILIVFTVLCLTLFTTLALASAESDRKLTEKSLEHIRAFYAADCLAVDRLAEVDALLHSASVLADSEAAYRELLATQLGESFHVESGEYSFLVPLEGQQFVLVKLGCLYRSDAGNYQILEWRTENRQTYEIDDTLPVWTGE